MSYELIITEKPQSANKIATALADSKPIKKSINKVPYYEITHDGKDIVIGCAVGHLYSVGTKGSGKWTYPVFDIEWQPIGKLQKKAAFASKYITALRKIAKDAAVVTIACDYDIEGEVIGYNILRFICKKKDGNRMKFSTLTTEDLQRSYMQKSPTIDWGQANAGITRHELDWYYGINMSRALMHAIKSAGAFKILSAGRVQGPALKTLVEKEKEIKAFVPEPFWQIELNGKAKEKPITALHEKDKFFSEDESLQAWAKVKDQKIGRISDINRNRFRQNPPFPFDLTTLQTEAYRSLKIVPKKALEIAQSLYTKGLISYPRTSSQKLPKNIGYQKILEKLKSQSEYAKLAGKLLKRSNLRPNEGKKDDPAHPAIYPTGNRSTLEGWELRIYDLVVRRFMATFADPAVRESAQIRIDVNKEPFIAKGTITIEKGWHEFYGRHVKLDETLLPNVVKDDQVDIEKMDLLAKETQPPKRYTPASIIKELEKRNLGTKATRAQIIENLFSRGYITGTSIEVTALGMLTCETLDKHVPMMLDEELTRHFEDEMEKIREQHMKPEQVLSMDVPVM
jgi:DNA topoisomerase-1